MEFARTTPEAQGVPSAALGALLDFLNQRGVPMHSLLVARHGALVLEAYWAPFAAGTMHRMFSQTKSLVSLAVGLLCEEGRLSLDDAIVRYFPDKLPPQGPSPALAALTIRDMLRMATPFRRTTYKDYPGDDWVGSFFTAPADHWPGAFFSYDTSSTHTLCALVERLSGQTLLGYLRGKLLDEIGFSPDAYCLADPCGISQGGSGLMARPMDMLRLLAVLAGHGCHDGRQLLPRAYLEAALTKQIDTEANGAGGEADFAQGYGYQFWRLRHGGWCMYGMGGQLSVCLPEQDLWIVTTADTQGRQGGVQLILDALWTLLPRLSAAPLPPDPAAHGALCRSTAALALPVVAGLPWPGAHPAAGRRYPLAPNRMGLAALQLDIAPGGGVLHLWYAGGAVEIPFGAGGNRLGRFAADGTPCAASAAWKDGQTLLLRVQLLGERMGQLLLQLAFCGGGVSVLFRALEEYPDPRFDGTATGGLTLHPAQQDRKEASPC